MLQPKNYILYFKSSSNKYRILDSDTNEIKDIFNCDLKNYKPRYQLTYKYKNNDDGLNKYHNDFKKWSDELLKENINITHYNSFYFARLQTYSRYSDRQFSRDNFICHDKINRFEAVYIEACSNGGLIYGKEYEGKSYGYDFNFYYVMCMMSKYLIIPTKKGRLMKIDNLNNISIGYYRVIITSTNDDFNKVFAYSKKSTYTHDQLLFAIELKDKFDVNIRLITDCKYNAYIYNEKHTTTGQKLFGTWGKILIDLKDKYPENKLIKMIGSMTWGCLIEYNTIKRSEDDLKDIDFNEWEINDWDDEYNKYTLINRIYPYKRNIRLKAFLSSFCRIQTARIALRDIKHVIRIHTDNITFNRRRHKKLEDVPRLEPEEKTSGYIRWINANTRHKRINDKWFKMKKDELIQIDQ